MCIWATDYFIPIGVSGGSHKPLPKTQHQTKPSQATPTDSEYNILIPE